MLNTPENFFPQEKKETSPRRAPDECGEGEPLNEIAHQHVGPAFPNSFGEPIESLGNTITTVGMTFNQAMKVLLYGGSVQRSSWPDPKVVVKFVDEKLKIYGILDNLWHPLIVSIGDVTGTDWLEV